MLANQGSIRPCKNAIASSHGLPATPIFQKQQFEVKSNASQCSSNQLLRCNASTLDTSAGPKPQIEYTSYEANSQVIKFPNTGIGMLVDPWYTESFTFGDERFAKITKADVKPSDIDIRKLVEQNQIILLSQSLEDHADRATLSMIARINPDMPVVGTADACDIAASCGLRNVTPITYGETKTFCDGSLKVSAFQGSAAGPPWVPRQNGYVIQEFAGGAGGTSVMYEPHCDFVEAEVAPFAPVDFVLTPVLSVKLLGSFEVISGDTNVCNMLRKAGAKALIPQMNGTSKASGVLSGLLSPVGSNVKEDIEAKLGACGLPNVSVVMPPAAGESKVLTV